MSSASSIADGLQTLLSAASVFGTGMVGKAEYRVLEQSSGSCAVIEFADVESRPTSFGNPRGREREWTYNIKCYLKDTGDPISVGAKSLTLTDTILLALESDDTIQGTVDAINRIHVSRELETALEVGGFAWLPFDIAIDLVEEV